MGRTKIASGTGRPRFLAPEVIQTSAVDCGPATLKCLLEGFGVPVSYGRLREACQTDVDGTSITTIERIAQELGLEAEQRMFPVESLFQDELKALPALVVVRQPDGSTHFVVLWRRHGRYVQVMDPASGRCFMSRDVFASRIFVHEHKVAAADWRTFTGEPEFLFPLGNCLRGLGAPDGGSSFVKRAETDPGYESFALLDAASRMVHSLVSSSALSRGREATAALEAMIATGFQRARAAIPYHYWSVTPADPGTLVLRGALIVRILGRRAKTDAPLSPELRAALAERPREPWREIVSIVRQDGLLALAFLFGALFVVSLLTLVEAVALRGLLDLVGRLPLPFQRMGAIAWLLVLVTGLFLVELPIALEVRRLGRHLECRMRLSFLAKLPRLSDRYFRSRPVSDMAARSHTLHLLRGGGACDCAPVALISALASIALPLALQGPLKERDLRVRTHAGALARITLDAMVGLVAVRTHGAERSIRREHEKQLTTWAEATRAHLRAALVYEGLTSSLGFALACLILADYVGREQGGGALLILYWALALPALGQELALYVRQYPAYRNVTYRLMELLGAPEEEISEVSAVPAQGERGVQIELSAVRVVAAGKVVLDSVNVSIPPGAHVAIVGPSGAGKSSLVGILLGWHRAIEGVVEVDGRVLTAQTLAMLRDVTAWVDPEIHIWNRTLLHNLLYGTKCSLASELGDVVETADLENILKHLPEGLQSILGEGGGLVSGGEGQRVRFGRALGRREARLVILDEPFRGLEAERRHELLARARISFREATLLCITHDVRETLSFPRVLVVEGGHVVEDGDPKVIAEREGSRYRALLEAEREIWESFPWRRLRLQAGRLVPDDAP